MHLSEQMKHELADLSASQATISCLVSFQGHLHSNYKNCGMWYLARKIVSVLFPMVLTYPAMGLNVCCHLCPMELNGSGVFGGAYSFAKLFVKLKSSMSVQQ